MLTKTLRFSSFLVALAALSVVSTAEAKKKKKEEPPAEKVDLDDDAGAKADKSDEEKPADDAAPSDEEKPADSGTDSEASDKKDEAPSDTGSSEIANSSSAVEEKDKTYYFVGARLRGLVIPTFIIEAFGDGGQTVVAPNFGPEFGIRKNGFEWNLSLTYTSYVLEHTPFKSPSDPVEATELVDAHLKVLYAEADFDWSHDFSPEVAWTYGGGFGLGIVWGPLYRAQAYPTGGGWDYCSSQPARWTTPTLVNYCSPDPTLKTQHYHDQNYEEPSWTDGGSKPIVFPWLSIQTGLRWKPTHAFVGRVDVGIGFGQVFFGLGADYGL